MLLTQEGLLYFTLFFIPFLYAVNRIIAKYKHAKRDSQFKELAQKFNLQISLTPQILEGDSSNFFGVDIGKIQFKEERKIFGVVNGKAILVQDCLPDSPVNGMIGVKFGTFSSPSEYGGKTSDMITLMYINNEIVSRQNPLSVVTRMFRRGAYTAISDIEKFILSV